MESPLIYVMLVLLNVFVFSSGVTHNKGKERTYFSCSGEGILTGLHTIKLFLTMDNLRVHCFFRNENQSPSKEILGLFTSGGLAPNMIITNSTFYGGYYFKLTPFSNRLEWLIDIPRENITVNTDIAAVEQWMIKITMHEGLNIYDTEGTLLDLVREPILQWNLGRVLTEMEVKDLYPEVKDIKVTKSPCANDVALIGFIMKPSSNVVVGNAARHSMGDAIYSYVGKGLLHAPRIDFDRRDGLSPLFIYCSTWKTGCISASQ
ncbi:cation channel sperm-associated protein subunit beta-like, partial [Mus caroli]|uniref:Cation channel sperm-associated protein subunit beta-like n=1 Tax=Mus caroli TaxID=10089 RepID=A0A6P5P8E1_MUSCR